MRTETRSTSRKLRSQPQSVENNNPDRISDRIMVYVGPNVAGLSTRTILGKSIPPWVAQLIAECPVIQRLIVPLRMMATMERAIATPGSQAYADAHCIQQFRR